MNHFISTFLSEFLASFVFIFIGGGAVASAVGEAAATLIGISLVVGLAFAFIMYAFGVDGEVAKINPLVSIGALVSGKSSCIGLVGLEVLGQILGAVGAALLLLFFLPKDSSLGIAVGSLSSTSVIKAFLLEALLAFIFVYVFIHLVSLREVEATFASLFVGLVLVCLTFVNFPLGGVGLNPLSYLAPSLVKWKATWNDFWVLLAGPLFGALLAGLLVRLMSSNGKCVEEGLVSVEMPQTGESCPSSQKIIPTDCGVVIECPRTLKRFSDRTRM